MASKGEQAERRAHWQQVHQRQRPDEVSWFQSECQLSLEVICGLGLDAAAPVIDVGGGGSRLVDGLLERGFTDLAVLDVSEAALQHSRERLGERASQVSWIAADVLEAELGGPLQLWHDRAVFHFLTEPAERERYSAQMRNALAAGGHALVATFAEDGPTKCSGLDVMRYSPPQLQRQLGGDLLELVDARREIHVTPQGREQRFQYSLLRKR